MKPFRFTLQAVRTVREREAQQALHEYVALLRALEDAKSRLRAAEEDLADGWDEFRRAAQANASAAELTRVQDWCELLLQRRREADAALKTARFKAHKALARYLAAHQACAVVEKGYARQRQAHERLRRKHEQKLTDDLAQRTFVLATLLRRSRRTVWN